MGSFAILLCVYKNDNPEYFKEALRSITAQQTIKPDEVVIVVDGPVSSEIVEVISNEKMQSQVFYNIVRFEQNRGLGIALQKGIEAASNEIVMRMDSDDIAEPDRFEKQLKFMEEHPDVAICGGQIDEFIDEVDNIVSKRIVPCTDEEIRSYMKSRCPFNHMTVALRRSEVLRAGNYQPWFWNEDYYLWIRMMMAGCKFANLPDTLVNVRVGKDMYARRGGWKYFISEKGLQDYMLQHKIISLPQYLYNVTGRFAVQVVMPNWLRGFVFQKLFRK